MKDKLQETLDALVKLRDALADELDGTENTQERVLIKDQLHGLDTAVAAAKGRIQRAAAL